MRFRIGVRKKSTNQLNWGNKIKIKKSNYDKKNRLNQLEYFKKYLVRFGFGFISLKP
jgi:hypothetical protein